MPRYNAGQMTPTDTSQRTARGTGAGMPLSDLLERSLGTNFRPARLPNLLIRDVCHDSRLVGPGALFVAVPGTLTDGAGFVTDAVRRGAVAVVADREISVPGDAVLVTVDDAREAISRLAACFFGLDRIQADESLRAIGITGTNGKSTVGYMIRAILQAARSPTALWGTIEYDLLKRRIRGNLTTPDPIDLIRQMVEARAAGAQFGVMEVSSHSLDQRRTAGIRFSVAVFTNLTQDHLDYHRTIEAYLLAKQRLFRSLGAQAVAVVNADDPASARIVEGCDAPVIRFGLSEDVDVRGVILSESAAGGRFLIQCRGGGGCPAPSRGEGRFGGEQVEARTSLVGRHNVSNALAATSAALALGMDLETIRRGLSALRCVPGRLQRVDTNQRGFDVFVDYAHTDDALRNVLGALRPLTSGRLWCVFGCGGDRDRAKRPLMARAVAEGADAFVMTSDNPRTEDPLAIIDEIRQGLSNDDAARAKTEPDRANAIAWAIEQLAPGDTLLIAGKGHEDYQIVGEHRRHFDDVETAAEAIARS
jgi:UDP-N-acetylmuramoyl-L-alanyl-D-glutamate--2,6-diaminopimelate ligase